MLASLLPAGVVLAEEHAPERLTLDGRLLAPEERSLVVGAGERRRRDFTAGRACAHRALAELGHAGAAVLAGASREPLWPGGVVGSITHCDGYAAAAAASADQVMAIGVDAEPLAPLPDAVATRILADGEEPADVGGRFDPVLLTFSAKEAAFKAWYPLTHQWLELSQASVRTEGDHFVVTVLVEPGPGHRGAPARLAGRWAASDRHVFCAVVVPAAGVGVTDNLPS